MFGLAYCRLDYEYMYEVDINILAVLIKAEINREKHENDLTMQRLAWQTALLMNATGNFKKPVKPAKLYSPATQQKKKVTVEKKEDIEAKRAELMKRFNI
ncbi:MAG: hypothetical protein ABF633_03200 [Clostridium sp.]|uniref:hypothetical protein n=1 Tax=Clostridium sp. TaxID=1506 RepID=UPI0039EBA313